MAAGEGDYSELARALRELFPDSSLELRPVQSRGHAPAAWADVRSSAGQLHLRIELLKSAGNAQLLDALAMMNLPQDDARDSIPVLAAPFFSTSKQRVLRDARAAFIDYAGNAWLLAPGVHVDRRGFSNPDKEEREQRNLFSDKASLVLRILLGARSPIGVRQIADIVSSGDEQIKLSPGFVSKIVKELKRQGYAAKLDDGIVLRHVSELLNDWLVSYRQRRQPVSRSYFLARSSAEALMPEIANSFSAQGVDYVFTGHAGASIVDRHADFDVVDVYVRNIESAQAALFEMDARRVERGGNINLSRPYYRESAFYDAQMQSGPIRVASDIQLYLDLYDYPVRGREQAEHLFDRRIRPMIEKEDQL